MPPGADIYISSEASEKGKRLDSMLCSSTPCTIYVEPEHWITLKKQGYQTEHISPELRRSFAYWVTTVGTTALSVVLISGLGWSPGLGIAVTLATAVGVALIDVTNPITRVVDRIPSPIHLTLIDAERAKQGELERIARDQREAEQRKATAKIVPPTTQRSDSTRSRRH